MSSHYTFHCSRKGFQIIPKAVKSIFIEQENTKSTEFIKEVTEIFEMYSMDFTPQNISSYHSPPAHYDTRFPPVHTLPLPAIFQTQFLKTGTSPHEELGASPEYTEKVRKQQLREDPKALCNRQKGTQHSLQR